MGYEPCFAWLNSLSLSALQNEALCLSRAVEALREREREEEAAEAASKLLKEEEARQQREDEKWEAFYKVLGIS
jgi:hypothetical protein